MIGVHVVPEQLTVANSTEAFDGEGRLVRADDVAALNRLAASVVTTVADKLEVAA